MGRAGRYIKNLLQTVSVFQDLTYTGKYRVFDAQKHLNAPRFVSFLFHVRGRTIVSA